jgi:hypothetical protein
MTPWEPWTTLTVQITALYSGEMQWSIACYFVSLWCLPDPHGFALILLILIRIQQRTEIDKNDLEILIPNFSEMRYRT